jgi:hypothetical protein
VIGEPGGGWVVARATLAHERRLAAFPPLPGDVSGLAWREAVAERTAMAEPHKWYPQRAGRPDLVIPQAHALGRSADPLVRQVIAKLIELSWSARWMEEGLAAASRFYRPSVGPARQLRQQDSRAPRSAPLMIRETYWFARRARSLLRRHDHRVAISVPAISIAGTGRSALIIAGRVLAAAPSRTSVSAARSARRPCRLREPD